MARQNSMCFTCNETPERANELIHKVVRSGSEVTYVVCSECLEEFFIRMTENKTSHLRDETARRRLWEKKAN